MITALSAIIIFLLLILVHELGHFTSAKMVGIKVKEFAIGMGPAIFKKQKGETLYSLRAFPIGGFCNMEGEDEHSDDSRAFGNQGFWPRFLVLASGALMNILLGFLAFVIIMQTQQQAYVPIVDTVLDNSPAQHAGLIQGDEIVRIDGAAINIQNDFAFEMSRYRGGEINIEYVRNGQRMQTEITPMLNEEDRYIIGFTNSVKDLTFTSRISTAYYMTIFTAKAVLVSLVDLISGVLSYKDMSGPVGIIQHIGIAAEAGLMDLISLTAFITINLGVFNLLPLPALDGGRLLFLLIEGVRRKKIPPEKEGFVHFIGFALLIIIMILATTNDIGRFFTKQ
ncbi:MAG: RIP metalloprotease RseP [Clostridiaceae bacterium]|nr:RIP metalloprotease RseP [Clostridiaceae bacterium]